MGFILYRPQFQPHSGFWTKHSYIQTNLTRVLYGMGITSRYDLLRVDRHALNEVIKNNLETYGERMKWRKHGPASLDALQRECEALYCNPNMDTLQGFLHIFAEAPSKLKSFFRKQRMLEIELEDLVKRKRCLASSL